MKLSAKLSAGVLASMIAGTSACAGDVPQSTIELTRLDGSLRIEGFVSGDSGEEVTARLEIQHAGKSGGMTTRQARSFVLRAGERTSVAVTQINFGPDSSLTVDLVVEAHDRVIAQTQTRITADSN